MVFVEKYHDLIAVMTIVTIVLVLIQNYELLLAAFVMWIIIILIYSAFRSNKIYKKFELIFDKVGFLKKRVNGFQNHMMDYKLQYLKK